MELGQILSWVVGAVGLTGFYFAGKRTWWSWYINLACQILWVAYALVTGQPAFLVTAAVYSAIFAVNAYKWTKEHLYVKRLLAGEVDLPQEEVVEESMLVWHARQELARIGEDDDVINWYARVIREYSSFGHSGGSHMAILPTLTKLLDFKPLTDLTDDPDEWMHHGEDVWGEAGGVWQNRRDGRMFSKDGGKSYTCVDDPRDSGIIYWSLPDEKRNKYGVHISEG